MIRGYRKQGKKAEADALEQNLEEAKAKIDEAKKAGGPKMDFSAPTDAMKKDAMSRGIDLDDPRVVAMLEKLQEEAERNGGKPPSVDVLEREARDEARAKVAETVDAMSLKQIMTALDEMGIDHAACESKAELHELLVDAMSEVALASLDEENEADGGGGGAGGGKNPKTKKRIGGIDALPPSVLAAARKTAAGGGNGSIWSKERRHELVWPITIVCVSCNVM